MLSHPSTPRASKNAAGIQATLVDPGGERTRRRSVTIDNQRQCSRKIKRLAHAHERSRNKHAVNRSHAGRDPRSSAPDEQPEQNHASTSPTVGNVTGERAQGAIDPKKNAADQP